MQTKIKPNSKQTFNQQPYPATLGAKHLGMQQQQNMYSSQEMNLIQASTLGQQSFQASSIPQTYGLPTQMFKPAAPQSIMVLQEQPSNIRQITKQPSSSKSSSSLLAKTGNANPQMVSYEQPWMNQINTNLQQSSSSQGGLQYSKQTDHKIAYFEGQEIQNNHNNQYDKPKSNNNNNNQDMHQLSGRVIKKHQRHCSEAEIPKKLLLLGSGTGTISNIQNKEFPLSKENQGFNVVPYTQKEDRNSSKIKRGLTTGEMDPLMIASNQEEKSQNKVVNDVNWMIGSDDINRQRHSRQNSLNMLSLRKTNEVELSQQQQLQAGDLLKFQTYDQRKDSSQSYHSKEIKILENRNPPWEIPNSFLLQDSSFKPFQYGAGTVSSATSSASTSNKKSDQSQQHSKHNIPSSISSSNIQVNQNIYPHQLPRSATFNTLQYNSSKQPVIQGQRAVQIEKQQQQQQNLKQTKNSMPLQNGQNRNIQNKKEGYFEYQGYEQQQQQEIDNQQQRKIEQTNFQNTNFGSLNTAKRKNSEVIFHGLVSQQQDSNSHQNYSKSSAANPLSPNNTITSNNTSSNSSQLLGQNSSNSSRSPYRASSQKVSFGGQQQFNTDSTSNMRPYEQITHPNNLSKTNHSSISANGRINWDTTQNDTIITKPINTCNSLIYPQQVPDGVTNIYIPQNPSSNNYHCYPLLPPPPPSSQTNITFAEQLKIEKTKKLCLQDHNSNQFQQSYHQQQLAKSKQQPQSCNNSTSHHGSDTQQFTPFSAADTTAGLTKDFLSIGKSEGSSKQHSALKSQDPSRKNSGSSLLPLNFGIYEIITQQEENIAPLPNLDVDSKYFTLQYNNKGTKPALESQQASVQSHQKCLLQRENQQYLPGNLSNYDPSRNSQMLQTVLPERSGVKASYLIQDKDTQGTSKSNQASQLRIPSTVVDNASIPYHNSTQFNFQNIKETPITTLVQEQNTAKSAYNNFMNNSSKDSFWSMSNNNQQIPQNLQNNIPIQQNLPKWYLHDSQGAFETNKDQPIPKDSSQQLAFLESISALQQEQLIESINIRQIDSESSSLTQISTQRDELLPRIDKLQCLPEYQFNEVVPQNSYSQQITQGLKKDKIPQNNGIPMIFKAKDSFLADLEELTKQSQQNYGTIHHPNTSNDHLEDRFNTKKQSVFPAGIVYSSIESIPFFDNINTQYKPSEIEKTKTANQDQLFAEGQIKKEKRLLGEEDQQNSEDEENFLDFAELVCEEGDIAEQFKDPESIVLQGKLEGRQIEPSYGFNNVETLSNKLSTNNRNLTNVNGPENSSSISGGKHNLSEFQQDNKSNFQPNIQESREQKESRIKRELSEFAAKESEYPIFGSDNLEYLVMRDADYAADPNYLTPEKQSNITVNMRAVLFDWMMEVSEEFGLKRETYHIAINLVDRYLSNSLHIKKRDLQLLGVTSLYISSKLEEIYPPKIADFVCSTNNGYKPEEINQFELKILQVLKFMINPPTLSMWSNWFMSQWDIFIVTSESANLSRLAQQSNVQFKQPDEHSYLLFREFMQAVDVSVLDITSLQCDPRYMLASIMYIVLGKGFGLFDSTTVADQFTQGNLFFSRNDEFNDLFDDFAKLSFGFPLSSILQTIQYVALFFEVPLNKELPSSAKNDKDNVFKGYYEDFLAFQTHNKEQLQIIQGKL